MPSVFIPPTDLSSAVPVSLGGTGATTQAGAANAVLPSQSSQNGKYLTTDGTNVSWGTVSTGVAWGSITGTLSNQTDLQNALNAKASLSGATFTGGIVSTLGTLTTSTPMLDGTQTWNAVGTTFTGLKLNVTDTASASGSLLLDLQKGGTSQFKVDKSGIVTSSERNYAKSFGFIYPGNTPLFYNNGSLWYICDLQGNEVVYVGYKNAVSGGTSIPLLDMYQTWNNSGSNITALKLNVTNTASGASSNLLDLQVGGTSQFKVDKAGVVTVLAGTGSFSTSSGALFLNGPGNGLVLNVPSGGGVKIESTYIQFVSTGATRLVYDSSGGLQQYGSGGQANSYFLYAATGTNYERLALGWNTTSSIRIWTEKGGTGSVRDLALGTNATTALTVKGETQELTAAQTWNSNITVTGASGTGTTATLTFAAITIPIYVGASITVTGVNPSGYNGTFIVTASSTTSVSYANTTTGAYVSGGSITQNFTGLKLNVTNTASGASSNLLDLQVGGTSQFKVDKSGNTLIGSSLTISNNSINSAGNVFFTIGGGGVFGYGNSYVNVYIGEIDFGHTANNYAKTALIAGEDATGLAGTFEMRTGNNGSSGAQPHRLRIYNTFTSYTNYERLGLNWATNVAQIYTEKGSGGGTARDLVLGTNATTAITISGTDQSVTMAGALSDSIGNVRSIPQNSQTAAYVLAATDNGKHVSITTGGVTVNSGVFSVGQVVTIFNNSSSNQTITQGTSVTMYQAGTTNTGNRTLASYGVATVLCVASNTFVITGSGLS